MCGSHEGAGGMQRLKVFAPYFLVQLAPDVAAIILSFAFSDALCPARPFLKSFLFGAWGLVVTRILCFVCFWKVVHETHDDHTRHCISMLLLVLLAILFFWSNIWTINGIAASFGTAAFSPNTLAAYDTAGVLEGASYGTVHARAVAACDDFDTLARERKEGLTDSMTDACWYVEAPRTHP